MTRFLALDPSSRVTGWALFEGETLLQAGVLRSVLPKDSYAKRFGCIEEHLDFLLSAWHFTELAYEGGSWGKFKVPALQVAIQTIRSWCRHNSIHFYIYAPAAIKRGVTGHGRATKDEVARVICLQFPGVMDTPTHVTDAIGVGICHIGWQKIKSMEVEGG